MTLEDVPLNAPSTSQQSSHSTVPSHHVPKNYVSNDSSSSFDETPRCEISVEAASLAEPAMPKEIKRGTIAKVIKTQPVLSQFLVHLSSVEGGWRGGNCKEAQWRVGQLLYEIDETVTHANLLWNNDAMVHLCCTLLKRITHWQSLRKWVP